MAPNTPPETDMPYVRLGESGLKVSKIILCGLCFAFVEKRAIADSKLIQGLHELWLPRLAKLGP